MPTGYHHTPEAREKIRLGKLGSKNPMFGKTGKANSFGGRRHSSEALAKMRAAKLGNKNPMFGRFGETHPTAKNKGEKNPNWKGGKSMTNGYVLVLKHDNPRADSRGYVREHVLVADKMLGRKLRPNEVPHHRNEKRDDNREENLLICSHSFHRRLHAAMKKARAERIG